MFLQGLWPLKLDWDDVIDEEKLYERSKFENEANSLDELRFPLATEGERKPQMTFSSMCSLTVQCKQNAQWHERFSGVIPCSCNPT